MGRARDRASADLNGQEFILDADADTSISADTDDQIDIKIAGADDFQFTPNTFTAQSGSTIAAQALTATTITASDVVDITDTTDASDATGDTGALRTEGGASIAKKLYVGTDLNVGGAFTSVGIDDNADATAITIDSAENVGIGQAPETGHHANWTAVDFGNRGGLAQYKTTGDVSLSYNLYHDGAWKAKENDASARYAIGNGPHHIWYTGASASADASVTLTEAMRINSSGIVTKAVNPHFIGGVQSTVGSTSGYNEGTGQSMIANVAQDNTGSHYNTSNGEFTCPVDGVYQVNFHGFMHTNQSTGNYNIQIKLNASIMQYAYFGHVNGTNTYMSYSTSIRAAATNVLTIKLMNGLWYAADWRYFGKSICLLG
mgnify:FL=1